MQLEITEREADALAEALSTYMRNLRSEIYRTESGPYKKDLKEQEELLQHFREKLQKLAASALTF
jgi:hypothetical protein